MKTFLISFLFLNSLSLSAHSSSKTKVESPKNAPPAQIELKSAKAVFAGGCFWCEEAAFDELKGVTEVKSGFTGGKTENPTYHEVSAGGTGHVEAVEVTYDPSIITYEKLLEVFWKNEDPTRIDGQFCDTGDQYRPEIFYTTAEQKTAAEKSKQEIVKTKKFKEEIKVPITEFKKFYYAEDYHQGYHKKNPIRYKLYRLNCGRDKRLKQLWGN